MNGQASAAAAGTIDIGGDLTVHRIGFGAMRITGPGIWGEPQDRDKAKAALRRAVGLDVNFIDTADSYGPEVSETLIAETLYPYPDDLVIATKGGLVRPGPGRWDADGRPEHLRQACEGSLRRLRLDQIALYQFHRPDPKVPIADSVGALAELKAEGKIRHIGVSNVSEEQLRAAERVTPVVSVQNRYNVRDRSSESMVDLCEQEMLVFLPWAPIQDADRARAVSEAASRHGVSTRQVVLAWLLGRSPQLLPIPGSGSAEHVEANIAAASIELSRRRDRRDRQGGVTTWLAFADPSIRAASGRLSGAVPHDQWADGGPALPSRPAKRQFRPRSGGDDPYVAAGAAFRHLYLRGNPLAQLGDMADDADDPAALAQAVEDGHDLVEGLLVEGAEPFVHEECLHPAAACLGGDDVGEAQREREAGQEHLAA